MFPAKEKPAVAAILGEDVTTYTNRNKMRVFQVERNKITKYFASAK